MKRIGLMAMLLVATGSAADAGEQRCEGAMRRPVSEFTPLGDGSELLDTKSGLIWWRCLEGQSWTGSSCKAEDPRAVNPGPRMTFPAAQAFAVAQSTPEVQWRLPTLAELDAIREPNCYNPSFSLELFPTEPAWSSDGFFWTTTPQGNGRAVVSAIGNSDATSRKPSDDTNHVRLVRKAAK